MKRLPLAAAALAAALALLAPVRLQARDRPLTLGAGGVTGIYYQVGLFICDILDSSGDARWHGVRCAVQPTDASVFNVTAIRAGDLDAGIVQSDIQNYAYNGTGQFSPSGADRSLRALFSLQAEAFTLVASDGSGIRDFEGLKGKRVNLGPPGSGSRDTLELFMEEYGWTADVFPLAAEYKPAEMAGALCDGRIDAYVYVVSHPNGSVTEAANACPSHLAPAAGPAADAFMAKYPFYTPAVIKGGTYTGTDQDVRTFGPRATLVASTSLSDDAAYTVTKAVFTGLDGFKAMHPALAGLTPENMLEGNTAPFHPGALRYFSEAGLAVPE